MKTKFMLDPIKQEDKEVLKKAIEVANRKIIPVNREARFLRNFVLALMKQYRHYEKPNLGVKVDRFNLPYFPAEKKDNAERAIAELKIPKPKRIKINIPKPVNLPIKETIPKLIELVPEVPVPI